jgi:hypothetical protein
LAVWAFENCFPWQNNFYRFETPHAMPKLIVAVCLLAQSVSGETPATHEPIKWILTLVGATIFAAGAVALDNIIKRMRDKRGHNLPQLINEIFAEHQIAYPTFFVALLIGAQFKSDKYWAKDVVGILTFLAFLFYAISVYFTTLHEDAIHQDHMKHPCPGADCTRRLTTSTLLKMMLPTIFLALVLFGFGVYFSFATT